MDRGKLRKIGIILLWLALWQGLYLIVDQELLMASPISVLRRVTELMGTAPFWETAAWSLSRIMAGFLLGIIAGTAAAFAAARSRFLDDFLSLPMSIIKSTPVASFVILVFVWIRSAYLSIFIAFLMVLPMAWSNVREGIRSQDAGLLEMARAFHVSRVSVFRNITIPAVLPYFLSAARTGVGFAWKAGVAGEVIAIPSRAIGTQLYNAKVHLEIPDLFAWTAVIIILSLLLERLTLLCVEALAKRLNRLSKGVGA